MLTVKTNHSGAGEIKADIIGVDGKILEQKMITEDDVHNNYFSIPVNQLSSGIYFLQFTEIKNGNSISLKFEK